MIRPKLSLRRPLAAVGAGVVGLAAALAFASPASAHHSEIQASGVCDTATGEFVVTWEIRSYAPRNVDKYKFKDVAAWKFVGDEQTRTEIPGIAVTEGNEYPHDVDTPLVAEQRVPGDTTKVTLKVKAKWDNGFEENRWVGGSVELAGPCEQDTPPTPTPSPSEPEPTPTPSPSEPPAEEVAKPSAAIMAECDGSVTVTLANGEDATADAEFTVTTEDGFEENATVEPGESTEVEVPAEKAMGKITVTEASLKEPLFDDVPTEPEDCVEPGEPAASVNSTCDEMIFEIANPEDGETVNVTLTPSVGEPQTMSVEPGETETVSFPGSEGLTVMSTGDIEGGPIAWEPEEDCGGGGGGLPVTGAAAGGIAAGAVILVALGVTLFLVARRRRLTFTA